MILDTIGNADTYLSMHPFFAPAFDFLRRPGLEEIPPGRYPIMGDDLFAIISKSSGRKREDAKLERHRDYIDMQFVISGSDTMGWRPTSACVIPQGDYNGKKDIQFFEDLPEAWVTASAGHFCIFFPADAHAPLVGDGPIHKVVVKVAVSSAFPSPGA